MQRASNAREQLYRTRPDLVVPHHGTLDTQPCSCHHLATIHIRRGVDPFSEEWGGRRYERREDGTVYRHSWQGSTRLLGFHPYRLPGSASCGRACAPHMHTLVSLAVLTQHSRSPCPRSSDGLTRWATRSELWRSRSGLAGGCVGRVTSASVALASTAIACATTHDDLEQSLPDLTPPHEL